MCSPNEVKLKSSLGTRAQPKKLWKKSRRTDFVTVLRFVLFFLFHPFFLIDVCSLWLVLANTPGLALRSEICNNKEDIKKVYPLIIVWNC